MVENLQHTRDGSVWAWYRLGPHSWSLKSVEERDAVWADQLAAWSSLAGYRVRVRLSSVPFPVRKWAEHYHQTNGHGRTDEVWESFLVNQQARIQQVGVSRGFRAVGVRLHHKIAPTDFDMYRETGGFPLETLTRERRDVDSLLRNPGFAPVVEGSDNLLTEQEMWWLMHRSVGLGFQAPREGLALEGGWSDGDMAEFTEPVQTWKGPDDASVTVRVTRDGRQDTRNVVVKDLIRLGAAERMSAERDRLPWLATLDLFDFPVEVVATLDIIEGKRLEQTMEKQQLRAAYIKKHTIESGRFATQSQERAIAQAGRAADEVTTGSDEVATRIYGSIRMAVSGGDESEALDYAQRLSEYYATKQKMQLVSRNKGMHGRLREFIPGEPITQKAVDVSRMTARFWATSWPGSSAGVGDDVGTYSGYTTGLARRAVMVDDHTPTLRHERASNFVVTGTLGSGKTQFLAFRAAVNAMCQRPTLFNDPDGHAQNLARIPGLTDITRVINLTTGNAASPGMLNPFTMVTDPRRSDFDTEEEWEAEKRQAYMRRRQLVADTILKFVHPTVARMGGARGHILAALTEVGADYHHSPWEVVDRLVRNPDTARLAKEIAESANSPAGLLAFGAEGERQVDSVLDYDLAMLTVLTSPGLDTPDPSKDEEDWTIAEQLSVPIRMLAQFFGQRLLFTADRDKLKVGIFDELGIYLAVKSASDGVNRLVRTSRANRIAVGLGTQDASDLDNLKIHNWLTRKYLGRVESEEEGQKSLRLGGLTVREDYQTSVMKSLSEVRPGQFVMVDERRRAEVYQADMDWWPDFVTAMSRKRPEIKDTTWLPGSSLV